MSDILLDADDGDVAGLEELNTPNTQDTQSAPVVEPSRSTKGSKRTKNFHWEEDEVICSGWLYISKDPINGANQTRSTFWSRVHAFFEKEKKTTAVRSESSIMHRWLTIQSQVNKFCSYYAAIERRNKSGTTIQDKIAEASKMYMELDKDKKSFTLIPCWNILKEEDKWKAKMKELAELEKQADKKKNKSTKVSRPRDEATNNEAITDAAAQSTEERKRPQGIKKQKKVSSEEVAKLAWRHWTRCGRRRRPSTRKKEKAKEERFMASREVDKAALELEKKQVSNEEKKAEAELLKEEKEIMLVDKRSLDPLQLQYIEMMQLKIIARCKEN